MADKRRTRLIVKHEESLPMYSDITRVRQLLFNLLSNACKFTENGSVELSVERCEVNAVPGYRFSVRDTGIGMSPDQQRNLFQMFTQADSSTTRKYGGSGVGLALCAKLVELMHGSIALESALGKGTTATIWLPKEAERPTQTVTPTAHPPGRLIESSHDTVKS